MKKKGFTLIELLVVIGIIALLVSILMPALGKARELAKRIKCASQIRSCMLAQALYDNSTGDVGGSAIAVVGDPGHANAYFGSGAINGADYRTNETVPFWRNPDEFNPSWTNINNGTQLSSRAHGSLYLLVGQVDLSPKQFLCPSDGNAEEIDLQYAIDQNNVVEDFADLRNFACGYNVSYSLNDPWNRKLSGSMVLGSSSPVMADQSPRYDTDDLLPRDLSTEFGDGGSDNPNIVLGALDWTDNDGQKTPGNSFNHGTETQNVAFADSHVERANGANVGIREDNIFTYWSPNDVNPLTETDRFIGSWATTDTPSMYLNSAKAQDTYMGL